MQRRYHPRSEGAVRTRVREDLREALRWTISQPLRLQILAIASSVNLGANGLIFAVLLDLASEGVSATRIGLLNTVLAAAILLGAFLAPRMVDTVPTGVLAIVPVSLMALVGVFLATGPSMLLVGAAYAVLGIGIPAINASSQGFFTHITPVAMQGRVSSLMRVVSSSLMPLAPAMAGWGLDLVGLMPTMLVFAGVLALGALAGLLGRDLRGVGLRGLISSRVAHGGPEHAEGVRLLARVREVGRRTDHTAGGSSLSGVGPTHCAARERREICRTRRERM